MKRRNAAMWGNMFKAVSRKTKKISWLRRHEIRVRKVIRAINQDKAKLEKCIVHPYWTIEVNAAERRATYPDLIVLTDIIESECRTHVKYLKIELDEGTRSSGTLIRKIVSMTGTVIVLCPTDYKINNLIKAFHALKEEKIVNDGIFFCLTTEFLSNGLLGVAFRTVADTSSQFVSGVTTS